MNSLHNAAEFAKEHEINWARDPLAEPTKYGVHLTDPKPWNQLLGPVHPRGGVSGVVYKAGELIHMWGEPDRADQTFSVAKSYLALLTGKAIELGLITSLDQTVQASLSLRGNASPSGFESTHNAQITWRHLLSQTSEWTGTCFGIPDQVEHFRHVVLDPKPILGKKGDARQLQTPGSYWEYNDVRINQLSLALLYVYQESLAQVFRRYFLEPLSCADDFLWEGYENSWVQITNTKEQTTERIQSVPGGTHWGGGVRISTTAQAKIGLMMLNEGAINEGANPKQLISSEWISAMRTPCPLAPFYGLLTWLNPERKTFPGASESAYFMFGAGGNYVWIDPELDAVIVVRWINPAHFPKFTSMIASALV